MFSKLKEFTKKQYVKIAGMAGAFMLVANVAGATEENGQLDTEMISDLVGEVEGVIGIFMEPPLVWFVYLGIVAAIVGLVIRLIPKKRAR